MFVMMPTADRCTLYVLSRPIYGDVGPFLKYDTKNKVWQELARMKSARWCPGVAALGGRLYVVGGENNEVPSASGEVYNPITNEWSSIADMNEARDGFGLVALKGKLYALGGHGIHGYLSSVEVYEPEVDRWTRAKDLPRPMEGLNAVTYNDAVYLLHKGCLLCYEPTAQAQQQLRACSEMAHERYCQSVAVLNDRLYVVGGCDDVGDGLYTVERYSFTTGFWDSTSPRTEDRGSCAASAARGLLYVTGDGILEVYDPAADRWTRGPDTPVTFYAADSAAM